MKTAMFEQLLRQVSQLSPGQRTRLIEALRQAGSASEAARCIQCQFEATPKCPHCGHDRVHRHGQADGLQRYRCRACGKTFNALTDTPLSRLRHKGKWLDFLQQMLWSQTVRQGARERCASQHLLSVAAPLPRVGQKRLPAAPAGHHRSG